MWPSYVLIELTKVKKKVFKCFLLPLKLNIICLRILAELPQFGNPFTCCKYAVCENQRKGSRIN